MEYLLQMNLWKTSAQLQRFCIATLPSAWTDPPVLSFLFLQSHLSGPGSNEFTLPCLLELFSWWTGILAPMQSLVLAFSSLLCSS